MTVVHDDAAAHHARLPGDLPRKAAATHIGHFFAWATQAGLVSDVHAQAHGEDFAKLERRWFTGRDYVLVALDGRLTDEHLNEDGRAFAAAYYDSGAYQRDYEATLRAQHPSLYHVPDSWDSYAQITPVLDRRLAAFRADPALPIAAPAAASVPAPAGTSSAPLPLPPPPPLPSPVPAAQIKPPPPLPPRHPPPPPPPRDPAPKRTRRGKEKKGE